MFQALRGVVSRPHVTSPCLKSFGSRFLASKRSPFDTDQNEDGFMLVGNSVRPSSLRPNLNDSSSTTSDENWAQILQDVDPPSYNIMTGARPAMRSPTSINRLHRRHQATEFEQRAMDAVFERVFNMDASSAPVGDQFPSGIPTAARKPSHTRNSEHLEKMYDEKREAMMNCKSDQELLQWAASEVFLEPPANANSSSPQTSSDIPESSQPSTSKAVHPGIYGRVVALLMSEFRENYNNPHLAIAIFEYTRRRSIISFVTGCTTPSYNELMRTYWNSFRDLQTVVKVAEEMHVNGVAADNRTRTICLQIRQEALKRAAWFEGGEEEVLKMLEQLENLTRLKAKQVRHDEQVARTGFEL